LKELIKDMREKRSATGVSKGAYYLRLAKNRWHHLSVSLLMASGHHPKLSLE